MRFTLLFLLLVAVPSAAQAPSPSALTPDDYRVDARSIEPLIAAQYAYLDRFEGGLAPISPRSRAEAEQVKTDAAKTRADAQKTQAVAAQTDFDVILVMLLARDRSEDRLLGDVPALMNARPVAIRQTRQQNLVQTHDELVVERGPENLVFEIRVHPGKWARHRLSTP